MRWLRWLRWTLIGIAALAAIALGVAWWAMHRSLPRIDGELAAPGRFFQMDLGRRLAGGELSELFGEAALRQDIRTRRFRFRAVARQVVAAADPQERALLQAYADGVNAGLASLDSRPWEYLLLRARPRPWLPEDSVLV